MKPTLARPNICNATKPISFSFSVKSMISASEIVIYTNDSSHTQICKYKQNSGKSELVLPANSGLKNGEYYIARIYVYDLADTVSDPSNYVDFTCFSDPNIGINILDGQIITSSSYVVQLTYSQAENDAFSFYKAFVYNSQGDEIYSTGRVFAYNSMAFRIQGLEDENDYTISVVGESSSGIPLEINVPFHVKYIKPVINNLLKLSSDPCLGTISITSDIKVVTGISGSGNPIYIDNEKVDLRNDKVTFPSGFDLGADYTIRAFCENLTRNSTIMVLTSPTGVRHELRYLVGSFEKFNGLPRAYLDLVVFDKIEAEYISDYINVPGPNDKIYIWLQRKNGFYSLRIEVTS